MTTRYDILSARPKREEGNWWHKIGSAFEGKDGGMNCYLDSLPLPDKEGKVSFIIREAKAKDDAPPPRRDDGFGRTAPAGNGRPPAPLDDDIPFDK